MKAGAMLPPRCCGCCRCCCVDGAESKLLETGPELSVAATGLLVPLASFSFQYRLWLYASFTNALTLSKGSSGRSVRRPSSLPSQVMRALALPPPAWSESWFTSAWVQLERLMLLHR